MSEAKFHEDVKSPIMCGGIRSNVVDADDEGMLRVTNIGQSVTINDPNYREGTVPEYCPLRIPNAKHRVVSDFAVCANCELCSI